jgi:hypothetical protein
MEAALQQSEQKRQLLQHQSESMAQIYSDGLIKKNETGAYEVVGDAAEQQQLQAKRSKPKKRANIEPLNYDDVSVDLDLQEGDLD